jgi:hypothetical protein
MSKFKIQADELAATGVVPTNDEVLLEALLAVIGSSDDNAGDPTVIGLLKQIVDNTNP